MMIPHFRPSFSKNAIPAISAVIRSGYIAQGQKVRELEQLLAKRIGIPYACAVSSGTTALTLALRALDIGPEDEVVLPSYTCSALWHAVKAVGARAQFADIEAQTYNLDPAEVRKNCSPRTKAILFPHMFGQPGAIQDIMQIGIPVIEDIAQGIGARIDQHPAGSFGTIAVTSFYATKMVGAGEGGAVLSRDEKIIARIRDLRAYDEKDELQLRYNAKMTDITATFAIEQLRLLDEWIARRRSICRGFRAILGNQMLLPIESDRLLSNYYRCIAAHPRKSAREIIEMSRMEGIICRKPVFRPLHLYAQNRRLKLTEQAWEKHFSIPLYPDLTTQEIQLIQRFLMSMV